MPARFDWGASGAWHVSCSDGTTRLVTVAFDTVGIGFTGCTRVVTRARGGRPRRGARRRVLGLHGAGPGPDLRLLGLRVGGLRHGLRPGEPLQDRDGHLRHRRRHLHRDRQRRSTAPPAAPTRSAARAPASAAPRAPPARPRTPASRARRAAPPGASTCVESDRPGHPARRRRHLRHRPGLQRRRLRRLHGGRRLHAREPLPPGADELRHRHLGLRGHRLRGRRRLHLRHRPRLLRRRVHLLHPGRALHVGQRLHRHRHLRVLERRGGLHRPGVPARRAPPAARGWSARPRAPATPAREGAACAPTNPCAPARDHLLRLRDRRCAWTRRFLPAGTSCGAGLVCNAAGQCLPCTEGAPARPLNLCMNGTTTCASGTPVCVETTTRSRTGTSCGANQVCNAGHLHGLQPGSALRRPTEPCASTATISCATGTPVCTPQAWLPAGANCGAGPNLFCNAAHVCDSCTPGAACTPANPCAARAPSSAPPGAGLRRRAFKPAGTECGAAASARRRHLRGLHRRRGLHVDQPLRGHRHDGVRERSGLHRSDLRRRRHDLRHRLACSAGLHPAERRA